MVDFSQSLVASVYFGSNMYFWKQSGYFDVSSTLRPLLHLWSLSVEEQFYILMPITMYVAYWLAARWGISRTSRWRWVFWPVFIASLALSVAITNSAPSANFFLLPTRAWELLLGALLVLTPLAALPNRSSAELCSAIGAALLIYSVFFLSDVTPFPGANALFPCLGAALLIYAGTSHSTICNRAISLKPIVFVGVISYSLYLFHWPLIVLSRYYLLRNPRGLEIALLCAASVALATASHAFVEAPFRQKKVGARRNVLFAQGAAAMVAILAVGFAGEASGFDWRFPDFKAQTVAGGEQWGEGTCFLEGGEKADQWSREKCTLTTDNHDSLLLWGDSFAAHYVPGLLANRSSIPYNIVQYTFAGCPPVLVPSSPLSSIQ
jgi:peptidoglycan/LPS O-acetylase OafA/YrhL